MPRWFLISLVHPAISVSLALISIILPSTGLSGTGGAIIGAVGYAATLGTFMINLPGVLIIQKTGYIHSASDPEWMVYAGIATIILLTWALAVLPICCLLGLLIHRAKKRPVSHAPVK